MEVELSFEVSYEEHICNIVHFFASIFFLKLRGQEKNIAKKAVVDIFKINLSMGRHVSKKLCWIMKCKMKYRIKYSLFVKLCDLLKPYIEHQDTNYRDVVLV